MAGNSTVAAMTAASALTGTELFYVVQSGNDRKATATQIQTFIGSGLTINSTTITGGTTTRFLYDNAGTVGETNGFTWDATNKAITLGGATVTTSNPVLNLSQTWNAGAVAFTGIKANFTDSASDPASLLLDLQVGGTSYFSVTKGPLVGIQLRNATDGVTGGIKMVSPGGASADIVIGGKDSHGFLVSSAVNAIGVTSNWSIGFCSSFADSSYPDATFVREAAGVIGSPGSFRVMNATSIPAGGTASAGYKFSSTADFGVFFGSGAPSLAAAKGSLYLRSDGSGVNDRAYINTNGSTTWTAIVTVG